MPAQSYQRFTFNAGPDEFGVVELRLTEGLSETFFLEIGHSENPTSGKPT